MPPSASVIRIPLPLPCYHRQLAQAYGINAGTNSFIHNHFNIGPHIMWSYINVQRIVIVSGIIFHHVRVCGGRVTKLHSSLKLFCAAETFYCWKSSIIHIYDGRNEERSSLSSVILMEMKYIILHYNTFSLFFLKQNHIVIFHYRASKAHIVIVTGTIIHYIVSAECEIWDSYIQLEIERKWN